MKFLYDLLPVILFFGTFKVAQTNPDSATALCNQWLGSGFQADQAPVICATAAAIIVSLLQIGVKFVRREKIDPMLWISVAVILVFGSLTIWLHDEMFIKWKPTIQPRRRIFHAGSGRETLLPRSDLRKFLCMKEPPKRIPPKIQ